MQSKIIFQECHPMIQSQLFSYILQILKAHYIPKVQNTFR